jgi:hypothetical protein
LARPHRSGGDVVERAAIFAGGADFAEVMEWIIAHGGIPEVAAPTASGGLHERRFDTRAGDAAPPPRRFVLPPGALAQ